MAKPSDELIRLARATAEAKEQALSVPYSTEAWTPWRETAQRFMDAMTAEAAGENRYELEMAAKKAAQEPEADPGEES
ncbi:hypothetical protein ACFC5Z_05875 [Streptomyces sp. NPDC056004]|uniref:hypothetical protein n=1 Tax=unclassified Streptomyces TaxID=2593676 RepID=UPI0035E276B0